MRRGEPANRRADVRGVLLAHWSMTVVDSSGSSFFFESKVDQQELQKINVPQVP